MPDTTTLLEQLSRILAEPLRPGWGPDRLEASALAGLLHRTGVATTLVPRTRIPREVLDDAFSELVDRFPIDESDEYIVGDWCLAVDELLAACEWGRTDPSGTQEWEILMGQVRAFPEGLCPSVPLAQRILEGAGHGRCAEEFWRGCEGSRSGLDPVQGV